MLSRLRSSTARRGSRYSRESTSRQVSDAFGRLFSSAEEAFLSQSTRTAGELGRKFRRNRRQVFDLYLQQLKKEHDLATGNLRRLAVQHDRPDLAGIALRHAVSFNLRYWTLRLQLALGLPVTSPVVRWVAAPGRRAIYAAVGARAGSDAALQHTAVR